MGKVLQCLLFSLGLAFALGVAVYIDIVNNDLNTLKDLQNDFKVSTLSVVSKVEELNAICNTSIGRI